MPSETASVMVETSREPWACAISASAGKVFEDAEEIRRLHDDGCGIGERLRLQRGAVNLAGLGVADFFDFEAEIFRVGLENLAVFGMDRARDENVAAPGEAFGHQDGFGERGGTVVHGSVGDFLAGELAHQRLKFEDRGERALRELGLIGSVGSEEFAALDERVGGDRTKMLVHAGAEKGGVAAGIFRRASLKILDDLRFGERPGEIQRFAQAKFFRDRREQVFDGPNADGREHFLAFGWAFREIAHQAECSFAASAM